MNGIRKLGPGVIVYGVVTINGEKLFALQFLQARNPEWVRRPFFAKYDAKATWLDHLKPAFGRDRFFFEMESRGPLRGPGGKVIPLVPASQRGGEAQPDAA